MRKCLGTHLLNALLRKGLVLDILCRTISILGRLFNGKRFSTAHALGKLRGKCFHLYHTQLSSVVAAVADV